jgi:L-alanine-DL-glutamate epimerase-like enolase superfamily enzyme
MGGPLRDRVQAYATGFYRKRVGDAVSYLIDEAQQRAEAGFTAIKLKLGFGIDDDVRICRSIRRAIGEIMIIMVDANHAYDAPAAIRVGRRIDPRRPDGRSRQRNPGSPHMWVDAHSERIRYVDDFLAFRKSVSGADIRLQDIEELDIAWFEEPVPPEDLQGLSASQVDTLHPDRRWRG